MNHAALHPYTIFHDNPRKITSNIYSFITTYQYYYSEIPVLYAGIKTKVFLTEHINEALARAST